MEMGDFNLFNQQLYHSLKLGRKVVLVEESALFVLDCQSELFFNQLTQNDILCAVSAE